MKENLIKSKILSMEKETKQAALQSKLLEQ
ncbi:MAG: hypothetical protein H6Q46_74, partial [Deltaproteobacteria bacterium]|nr:hypothetical protein [Deltaproteobacteria bacterium]